jgi:hypothetical protein
VLLLRHLLVKMREDVYGMNIINLNLMEDGREHNYGCR